MNRMLVRTLAFGMSAAVILISGTGLTARPQSAPVPVYTAEQADAGRVAYARHCASCHMPDLSGDNEKPPLTGVTFMKTWSGRSTRELLEYMSGAMPVGAAALDPETYRALTAFLLRSNGASAGTQSLSSSTDVPIGTLAGEH